MISIEEAFERITGNLQPLDTLVLPLDEASGHRLADMVASRRHQPPADLSAMDGFAMQSDPARREWPIVGTSAAGTPFEGTVPEGSCIRIYTGAEVPEGADTVVIQENTNWPENKTLLTRNSES